MSIGQAIERIVVKDEDLPVSAHLDVAFDGEPARNRGLCCLKRVLDDPARGVVQAAVGDWTLGQPGRRVKRPQNEISNTPSTSASAFNGRCATPTVVRACRPRSPKTLAIRSDAPFITCGSASKLEATLKKPPSLMTRTILSRSPSASCAWARMLIAQRSAASRAASIGESGPSLPLWRSSSFPSGPERELAGNEEQGQGAGRHAACADERNVVGHRRGGLRQDDAELGEAFGGLAHGS